MPLNEDKIANYRKSIKLGLVLKETRHLKTACRNDFSREVYVIILGGCKSEINSKFSNNQLEKDYNNRLR